MGESVEKRIIDLLPSRSTEAKPVISFTSSCNHRPLLTTNSRENLNVEVISNITDESRYFLIDPKALIAYAIRNVGVLGIIANPLGYLRFKWDHSSSFRAQVSARNPFSSSK